MACSSGCRLYGFKREDSAAAIHCLAYSEGAISAGIEILGRTSYVRRFVFRDVGLAVSLDVVSKPVGEVALLDIEDRADETSSASVTIEEVIEPRALSGFRCSLSSFMNLVCNSGLQPETLICKLSSTCKTNHINYLKGNRDTEIIHTERCQQTYSFY